MPKVDYKSDVNAIKISDLVMMGISRYSLHVNVCNVCQSDEGGGVKEIVTV